MSPATFSTRLGQIALDVGCRTEEGGREVCEQL